jgi:hypothetical protein
MLYLFKRVMGSSPIIASSLYARPSLVPGLSKQAEIRPRGLGRPFPLDALTDHSPILHSPTKGSLFPSERRLAAVAIILPPIPSPPPPPLYTHPPPHP